jgi:hypothetical protein
MKKAKIMLTAITVLAVVGGALAFKARNNSTTLYTTNGGSDCNIQLVTFTTNAGGTQIDATLTAKTGACNNTFRITNREQ